MEDKLKERILNLNTEELTAEEIKQLLKFLNNNTGY